MFLPGEFHGLHSPLGHKESDMTEELSLSKTAIIIINAKLLNGLFFFLNQSVNKAEQLKDNSKRIGLLSS